MLEVIKSLVRDKNILCYYEKGKHNYIVLYLTEGGNVFARTFFSEEKACFFAEKASGIIIKRRG